MRCARRNDVILTTSPQTPGVEYAHVIDVMDLAGNRVRQTVTLHSGVVPIIVSIRRIGTNCVISGIPGGTRKPPRT
jgi:hypothetical protein